MLYIGLEKDWVVKKILSMNFIDIFCITKYQRSCEIVNLHAKKIKIQLLKSEIERLTKWYFFSFKKKRLGCS